MSMLPCYRLRPARDPSVPTTTPDFESCLNIFSTRRRNSPANHGVAHPIVAVAAPPVDAPDPATSERNGSITRDMKRRSPTHEWNSLDEFKTWRMKEQLDRGIELLLVRTISASSSLWHEKRIYVCSRQRAGGKSKSIGKHRERIRSRPSSRTGCRCRVIVKTYPHTSTVLGWYRAEHDHATGILRHMKPKEVLMRVHSKHGERERDHHLTMTDIHRIRKTIKQEDPGTRPISSNQPSYERSRGSPAEVEELLFSEYTDEAGSSQVDEKPEVCEQSNRCADPGTRTSPTPGPASHRAYTAESTPITVNGKTYHHLPAHLAAQAAALPPLIPRQRPGRPHSHRIPVSAPTLTSSPVISSAIHIAPAPTPAVVPVMTHNIAPPVPPQDASVLYHTPQPLVVYMPHPPYQMSLYPVYPVYYPPPNI